MKSIYSKKYRRLIALLVEARKNAGITQQQLAAKLERYQSFVSKYEAGERRLDVAEYVEISRLIGADPYKMMRKAEV